MNISSMVWQPALIKLTNAIPPEEGTPAYIAPQWITAIERRRAQFSKVENQEEKLPPQTCTYVWISGSMGYWVQEPPAVIAMMRDRALGHEPPKPTKAPRGATVV